MNKKIIKWPILITPLLIITITLAGCYTKRKYAKAVPVSDQNLVSFTETIRKIDGQAEAHYKMALFFQKDRRYKLSLEELEKALERNPDLAKAHNAMGVSYDKLRQYDKATRSYFRALKIDPKLDSAHNNLGYSQLLKGDFDKAIKAFRHAVRLNGKNNRYRNNLALAYVMNEQYDLAAEQFKIVDNEADTNLKVANLVNKINQKNPPRIARKSSDQKKNQRVASGPLVIKKKINLSKEMANSDAAVDFPAPHLQVSAVQITEGKHSESTTGTPAPVSVPSFGNRYENKSIQTSKPKMFPVAQIKSAPSILKHPNPDEPVSVETPVTDRVVHLQVESPVYLSDSPATKPISKKRIIEVAAAKSTENPTVATGQPKLPDGPFEVELEIANGNGVKGMAHKVGKYLELRGFKVVEIKNAHSFDHLSTKVLYSSDGKRDLNRLLAELSIIKDASNLIELDHLEKRIRVVVGKDMVAFQDRLTAKGKN